MHAPGGPFTHCFQPKDIAMMTPQESQALQELLTQLTQVQGITKDAQASDMIGAAFARQPDAGYLLVQRTMLQDQALGTARAQISQLQSQLQTERESRTGSGGGASSGGFLDPSSAWGNSAANAGQGGFNRTQAPSRNQPQAAAPVAQQYADPQAAQNAPQPARAGLFGGGGGSSFLGSMAATAAGVAGGAFLFQGIGSLMGHHGGSGLMGQNGQSPVENTTVNNFYGSDAENTAGAEPERLLSDASDNSDAGNDDLAGNDDVGGSDDMSSI